MNKHVPPRWNMLLELIFMSEEMNIFIKRVRQKGLDEKPDE